MAWKFLSIYALSAAPARLTSTTSAFLVEGVMFTPGIGNVSHVLIGSSTDISTAMTGQIMAICPIPAAGLQGAVVVDAPSGGPNEIDLAQIFVKGNTNDKLVVSYHES